MCCVIFYLGLNGGRMADFGLSLHSGGDEFGNVGFFLVGGLHLYGYEFSRLL